MASPLRLIASLTPSYGSFAERVAAPMDGHLHVDDRGGQAAAAGKSAGSGQVEPVQLADADRARPWMQVSGGQPGGQYRTLLDLHLDLEDGS